MLYIVRGSCFGNRSSGFGLPTLLFGTSQEPCMIKPFTVCVHMSVRRFNLSVSLSLCVSAVCVRVSIYVCHCPGNGPVM